MVNLPIVLLIIGIVLAIIFLTIFTVITLRQAEDERRTNPTFTDDSCSRTTDQLIDISDLPCCCSAGQQSNSRFVSQLNGVVSPSPTYYVNACSGFCVNATVSENKTECVTGPSADYQACIELTIPVNCNDSAMPVAVDGIQFYYLQSATSVACPTMGQCAPANNTCSV